MLTNKDRARQKPGPVSGFVVSTHQALGRRPWFAALPLRARRLRPRLLIVSPQHWIGNLSILPHKAGCLSNGSSSPKVEPMNLREFNCAVRQSRHPPDRQASDLHPPDRDAFVALDAP